MQQLIFIVAALFVPTDGLRAAAISTSSPYSSQIAMEILRSGGSAADAACAAVFALNVAQPYFTGIGGGGFAVVAGGKSEPEFLNFRESSPSSVKPDLYLNAEGKPIESWQERNTGPNSVAVPGTVAGCQYLHERYGKLSWQKLLEPAVKLAREGIVVTQNFQDELDENWKRLAPFPFTRRLFGGANRDGLKKGEGFVQPALANTLERIEKDGPKSFYVGGLADAWLRQAAQFGVKITSGDLARFKVERSRPLAVELGAGISALEADLPSSAGLTVLSALRFIWGYYAKHGTPKPLSFERYVVTAETMGYLAKLSREKIADAPRTKLWPRKFLGSGDEKRAFAEIERKIAKRLQAIQAASRSGRAKAQQETATSDSGRLQGHTSHISVVDDAGLAVALTSSVNNVFGSGITLPEFGFLLNSENGDFDAEPGRPNSVTPDARPFSNMSPMVLLDGRAKNKPALAVIGAAGDVAIPSSIVEFFENYYLHKLGGLEALKAPRIKPGDDEGKFTVEKAVGDEVVSKLRAAGYEIEAVDTIWAILESVVRRDAKEPWEAVADPRYDGLGLVSQVK